MQMAEECQQDRYYKHGSAWDVRSETEADLVNQLTPELVVFLQDLVPQVTVHALNNVSSLDLEQTADITTTNMCLDTCVVQCAGVT